MYDSIKRRERYERKVGHKSHPYILHGLKDHPIYPIWLQMKARCVNPRHRYYDYYGGRGISVCDRWRDSFPNFLEDMGDRPDGLEIERINNDGNYEPNNCKWATRSEQMCNRRRLK